MEKLKPWALLIGRYNGAVTQKVWQFLKNLNIEFSLDSAVLLPGTSPKDLVTGTQTDTCMPVFITAFFIIATIWKQPKCPSTDEWINKM